MGNLCQKDTAQDSSHRSSIYYEPRKGICIKENIEQYLFDRKKSLLIPSVGRVIIKEELDQEIGTPKLDESLLKGSHITTSTSNLNRESQSCQNIQLMNVQSERFLHSHRIRHQHSRLNEVSCCQDCHGEYDTWQFEYIGQNIVKIYHPLTKCYLKVLQRSSSGQLEVGGSEKGDIWIIEKLDEYIRIRHKDSNQYLQSNISSSKVDGQVSVSLIKNDCGKPEEYLTWKAIEN